MTAGELEAPELVFDHWWTAETSSSAVMISTGTSTSSDSSAWANCDVVRAPRIADDTAGRSRSHASAAWIIEMPSPSAARASASTTAPESALRYGCTKRSMTGLAARESPGIPVRYLPVSTPRPSGDHARTPIPNALAAGTTSVSMSRLSSEYSTWVLASTTPSDRFASHAWAYAVCQPA